MYKPVKLTMKTARELVAPIIPGLKLERDSTPPDVAIFRGLTRSNGLEIRCENDWFNHNGRIKITISDLCGGSIIQMYFHPDTLNRDFVAEQADKDDEARDARRNWVQMVGRERAHKLVDQYWEG